MSGRSFTTTYHKKPYPTIDPRQPKLSAAGKTIVISGGGKGIGEAIAKSFAVASAANIVIFGRKEADLSNAKTQIEKYAASKDTKVYYFIADVLDKEAIDRVFSTITRDIGLIDIFVNNAGHLSPFTPVAEADASGGFWRDFEVNVKGSLLATQAFLRNANRTEEPIFLSVSAGAAHVKYVFPWASYAASKAAWIRVVDHIEVENPWLRVHQIHPGVFKTTLATELKFPEDPGQESIWEDSKSQISH